MSTRDVRRCSVVLLLATALLAGLAGQPAPAGQTIVAESLVSDAESPASFTLDPAGRIFYAEAYTAEIRIFDPATSTNDLFFVVPEVVASNEQGLFGLALDPGYPAVPYLYAFATRGSPEEPRIDVMRITDSAGTGTDLQVLFTTGAAEFHNGGRMLFGPDGLLYVSIGDRTRRDLAQDLSSDSAKLLRMTSTGEVPADNPFPDSYVFALGLRNSFGFTFDNKSDFLWLTDNGSECNDELNRIVAGRNYGWGAGASCEEPPEAPSNTNQDGDDPVLPKWWWGTSIAPTGTVFCRRCGLGKANRGTLFLAAYNTGEIHRMTLSDSRKKIVSDEVVYDHPRGIISMERGPDGTLYFSDRSIIYRLVRAD